LAAQNILTELSVLLVQIRAQGPVRDEELQSFARHGGLAPRQITVLNVFDTPRFAADVVDSFDVVCVGGASEASVLDPHAYPFVPPLIGLLTHCLDRGKPVFASCFGFQAAVLGLGGRVIRDEGDFEMGTIPLQLTPEAETDPVFEGVSDGFLAVSCHRERAVSTPPGCVPLAETGRCLYAFRVVNKPFWAFQFHPELDRDCFVERLGVFRDQYTESDGAYTEKAAQFKETPESNGLLRRFLQVVSKTL
jgi:GMP synthase (glutamine-hydrolysing)